MQVRELVYTRVSTIIDHRDLICGRAYVILETGLATDFTIQNPKSAMKTVTIEVWDATGNKKQWVELPADAPVNRVIAILVDKMNLPRQGPDGQLMSYKFHHKASGRQLLDTQTLLTAEVGDGDVLRLQPEITAGAGRRGRYRAPCHTSPVNC